MSTQPGSAGGAEYPLLMSYWPGELRPYQQQALTALATRWRRGDRRAWVVLPPGSGKTLVGLEAARRLGRRTVVLTPNTAIQSQWIEHWEFFTHPDGTSGTSAPTAGASRSLTDAVTVLTYQSLAVFSPDAETDEEGRDRTGSLRERLHPNGQQLVAALHDAGPLTLVLDECHHLLQVWGRLLAEILTEMPEAHVIGLTGTPGESLSATEHELVDTLFGPVIHGASIPALVRDGYLAPFAELAWLTSPTPTERDYLAENGQRFQELCTDLLDPDFASVSFLGWLHTRFHERRTAEGHQLDWEELARRHGATADATLRLHHAGLIDLPPGARLVERHRHAPHAEDWIALLNDYVTHCLRPRAAQATEPPEESPEAPTTDAQALDRIRAALPAVGYQLTKHGIRRGRSPADRVLARSAAKSHAAVEIAGVEAATLGAHLRLLVLCDHEHATARLSPRLRGVLPAEAGSAWLLLELLSGDERTRHLNPILVTGSTVAAAPGVAENLRSWLHQRHPGLHLRVEPAGADTDPASPLAHITGAWTSRTWVRLVTEYLEAGHAQALIGTRALLGEGWDAPQINTVVDLTTATTTTAVTQNRGRALRLDPTDPDKVAHTWTVTCVSDDHPKGHADWDRLVRKHQGYLGVNAAGEVLSGVAHIDDQFSPYAPPPTVDLDAINARMIARAQDRQATRARWRIGEPYVDTLLPTLQIRTHSPRPTTHSGAAAGHAQPPLAVPSRRGFTPTRQTRLPGRHPWRTRLAPSVTLLGLGGTVGLTLAPGAPDALPVLLTAVATVVATGWWLYTRHTRRRALSPYARAAAADANVLRIGCAVADALHETGQLRMGSAGLRPHVGADGTYRITFAPDSTANTANTASTDGVGRAGEDSEAELFTSAFDEVLSPLVGRIRYLIPRYELSLPDPAPVRLLDAAHTGRLPVNPVTYHRVPTALARNRAGADAFARAWNTWVSDGAAVYTGAQPNSSRTRGQELLYLHHGSTPFPAETATRLVWS
ncbi:DEAD/DEAH box helicase family protein [Lipingzhangella sp. LS1_29]|uniref:DEAD/DEAH box helicase family protein n=1 Tax=Lipingzhangella rawalii TaxID=2055835 RepID=A0ABU2HB93_9ACTN|nr:DEAD/DEAH box helicase family protein [Lipingzhangella rawalii]MDS1272100.1 DEAD/DEAH box helicase family protein [Lipingzhangella rawalii]